jgi:hypothetical protein
MNMEIDQNGALYGALAKAQGEMSNPIKNREVSVKSDKGSYKFAYATLDSILDIVRAPLAKHGLSFTQTLERREDGMVMCLRLYHAGGASISTSMPIDSARVARMQELGSLMTFARRYQVASFFGLAAEEDDDANAADGNSIQQMRDKPSKADPAKDPRAAFKLVRDEMNAATSALELADTMLKRKDLIVLVKGASEAGYAELIALKDRLVEGFNAE